MKTEHTATPETDEAIFRYGCPDCGPIQEEGVEPKFARRLERERDEALESKKDLLESLNRLVAAELASSESFEAKEIDEIEASMKQAYAAIAKATGEQQS